MMVRPTRYFELGKLTGLDVTENHINVTWLKRRERFQ